MTHSSIPRVGDKALWAIVRAIARAVAARVLRAVLPRDVLVRSTIKDHGVGGGGRLLGGEFEVACCSCFFVSVTTLLNTKANDGQEWEEGKCNSR